MNTNKNHGVSDQPPTADDLPLRSLELLRTGSQSTLATQSTKHPGFPFASVMPYALTAAGRPIFLISSMATHTKNLLADPRASLLVAESETGDRLAGGRVTVVGTVKPVDDDHRADCRQVYLAKHPSAEQWVDFGDFAFFEMQVEDIYIVAGFGSMGWVKPAEYFEKVQSHTNA